MKTTRTLVVSSLLALAMSACNVLPEPEQTRVYPLQAEAPAQSERTFEGTLRIAQPTALQAIDMPRLAVIQADGRQAYWQGVRLQDRLPLVVQENLVKGLGQSKVARYVVKDSAGSSFDVEMQTHIESFAVHTGQPGSAHIAFRVQLRQASDRRVVASQNFNTQQSLANWQVTDAVSALEHALSELQGELAQWLSEALN